MSFIVSLSHRARRVISSPRGKVLLIFIIALAIRLPGLVRFTTPDEFAWVLCSARFLAALIRGDWAATLQMEHPGVTVMWLGAASMILRYYAGTNSHIPLLDFLAMQPRRLLDALPLARLFIVLLISGQIATMYALTARLVRERVALLAALLLCFAPFHVALSRVLHLDALSTGWAFLTVLSYMVYQRESQRRYWLLAALMAALAALTKSVALFAIGFVGILTARKMATAYLTTRAWRNVLRPMVDGLLWLVVVLVICVMLWPALWGAPRAALSLVFNTAVGHATAQYRQSNFFMGEITLNPDARFYPVVFLFRITPVTLAGLGVALISILLDLRRKSYVLWRTIGAAVGLYIVLFLIAMTFAAYKFDRYMLMVFPAVALSAAWGIWQCTRWRIGKFIPLFAILIQVIITVSHFPYYFTYYNPIVGGARLAPRTIWVGWGEGLEQAAYYLNRKPDAARLRVASWYNGSTFAHFFAGDSVELEDLPKLPAIFPGCDINYLVYYVSQVQRDSPFPAAMEFFAKHEPEHIVRLHGIDYAWVYRNSNYEEALAYLNEQAGAGDAIILNTDSLLMKHYDGAATIQVIKEPDAARVAARLQELTATARRVWYVYYPEAAETWTCYYLNTRGYKMTERDFGNAQITSYELGETTRFQPPRQIKDWHDTPVNFADELQLTAYVLSDTETQWRRSVGLVARWRALHELDANYTAFVHIVDDAGRLWGQFDTLLSNPLGRTTAQWATHGEHEQWYTAPLRAGIPPGTYTVTVGVYDSASEARLPTAMGTKVSIGTIEVLPSPYLPALTDFELSEAAPRMVYDNLEIVNVQARDVMRSGMKEQVSLLWRATDEVAVDYAVQLILRDEQERTIAARTFPLVHTGYPPTKWRAGEMLRGKYSFSVPPTVTVDAGHLVANLQICKSANAQECESVGNTIHLRDVRIDTTQHIFELPNIAQPREANFSDQIRFLGYDLAAREIAVGEAVSLTLYWRAMTEIEQDYTVFVHLVDEVGEIAGQRDVPPAGGTRPTSGWLEGEFIVDSYEVPFDAAAGTYSIEIGMYDAHTFQRLPIIYDEGTMVDHIALDEVMVK